MHQAPIGMGFDGGGAEPFCACAVALLLRCQLDIHELAERD